MDAGLEEKLYGQRHGKRTVPGHLNLNQESGPKEGLRMRWARRVRPAFTACLSRVYPGLLVPGLLLFVAIGVAGCAHTPPPSPPPHRTVTPPPRLGHLIVLQSDTSPAYADVTQEIIRQWQGSVEIINVAGEGSAVGGRVQASSVKDVVAIGLPAARIARSLTGKKVVFCQVFNHEREKLVKPQMKGVSAVPPVRMQFKAWKEFDPRLQQVVVITGSGLRALMAEARAAAREQGIRLKHIVVHSNLALRAASKQLGPNVQGLWLVPDNRVLSRDVLRELLVESRSRGRQVLVLNGRLLSWGATLATESEPTDIASQVLARIRASAGRPDIPGPALLPLTKINVMTRPAAPEPHAGTSVIHADLTGRV